MYTTLVVCIQFIVITTLIVYSFLLSVIFVGEICQKLLDTKNTKKNHCTDPGKRKC